MLDLLDGDAHLLARELLQVVPELIDAGAALADDDAGFRGPDDHGHLVGRALGLDPADTGVAQPVQDQPPHLHVLEQQLRVVAIGVPACLPGPVDPEAEGVGMNLLTH